MIRGQDWRPAGGLVLEPNALAAVTAAGQNVVVAAGPGAGKTELLAQRADFLLRTGQCPYPRRILAVSFKVDAARNLRSRVRLRAGAQLAARFDSFTFQAFAKRLIDNFRPTLTGANALAPDYRLDAYDRIPGEQITFADLVPLALTILESNQYARGGICQTYSHVFLDEFQDATKEQYELVKVAFGESSAVLTARAIRWSTIVSIDAPTSASSPSVIRSTARSRSVRRAAARSSWSRHRARRIDRPPPFRRPRPRRSGWPAGAGRGFPGPTGPALPAVHPSPSSLSPHGAVCPASDDLVDRFLRPLS
jgi:hypothetical protein